MTKIKAKIKKALKRIKYMDKSKARYFSLTVLIIGFLTFVGTTYSYFLLTDKLSAATITIGKLK